MLDAARQMNGGEEPFADLPFLKQLSQQEFIALFETGFSNKHQFYLVPQWSSPLLDDSSTSSGDDERVDPD